MLNPHESPEPFHEIHGKYMGGPGMITVHEGGKICSQPAPRNVEFYDDGAEGDFYEEDLLIIPSPQLYWIYSCGIQYCLTLTSLFGYLSADLSICIMRLYM